MVFGPMRPLVDGRLTGNFPDVSPYVQKLVLFLRMCGVAYEYCDYGGGPVRRAPEMNPKGKVPFVQLPGGEILEDSAFIISRLERDRAECRALSAALTPEQHAVGHAIERMCEDHLFWGIPYNRWCTAEGRPPSTAFFFDKYPAAVGMTMKIRNKHHGKADDALSPQAQVESQLADTMRRHGLMRHSHDEIVELLFRDLRAVNAQLGAKRYLFGDAPSRYDAAVFGQVCQYLIEPRWVPHVPAFRRARAEFPALVRYCENIVRTHMPEHLSEIHPWPAL